MSEKDQLENARERVIDAIAQNMNLYNIAPSIGRLYGMLFFHDEPITLDDMKDELGMSKTSMSTSVRSLLELKMVDKVWKKGVRKDLYAIEKDWHQSFIDYFSTKWRNASAMNSNHIQKAIRELKQIVDESDQNSEVHLLAKRDIEKLHEALAYYDWLQRFIDMLESHQIFDYVPRKKDNN